MELIDKIYGREEVTEPVLIELIKSKPLQRLKGVNQAGSQYVRTHKKCTRFEHSAGVMILLKRHNAPLEEQVAGLLHDVSHTAFSHVVDFALGDSARQIFHEKFVERIIFDSEIPEILKKYDLKAGRVIDEENFPLLEQPIPNLCADRIDYFLKESTEDLGFYPEVEEFLNHIKIYRNEFVFDNRQTAEKFALMFMRQCQNSWVSPKTLAAFTLLAEAIKQGLKINELTEGDLFENDNHVYQKLKSSTDKLINGHLNLLNPNLSIETVKEDYDFHSFGKARYVDPKILSNGRLAKLSDLEPKFKKQVEKFKEKVAKGHKIKIIKQLD